MLSPIKLLLIVPLALLVVLFLLQLRKQTFSRLVLIGIAGLGITFVLTPDLTTRIANMLGVGRGTDLLLYLSSVAGFVTTLLLYAKLRRLEAVQTELVRAIAIGKAKPPAPESR